VRLAQLPGLRPLAQRVIGRSEKNIRLVENVGLGPAKPPY